MLTQVTPGNPALLWKYMCLVQNIPTVYDLDAMGVNPRFALRTQRELELTATSAP